MNLDWADAIDTACVGCGGEAVDWVQAQDGTRRYACEECLEALVRGMPQHSLADLPLTPDAVVCRGCDKLTLQHHTDAANRCQQCATGEVPDALVEAVAEAEQQGLE